MSAHNNHAQRTDNILNNVRRNEDYISTNMKILPDRQHLNKSNILHWHRLSKHTRHILALILTAAIMLSFLLSLTGCGTGLTLTTPISVTDYKLNTYVQIDSYTGVNKVFLPMPSPYVIITSTFSQEHCQQVSCTGSIIRKLTL